MIAGVQRHPKRREQNLGDRIFSNLIRIPSVFLFFTLVAMLFLMFREAWPAISRFGFSFLMTSVWDPVREEFGAMPVIYGTLISSFIGVALATPLSLGVALFLNELAPKRVANIVGFLVEMLAAIPSVVYGLWGIFVLAPWLRGTVQPYLISTLGRLPIIGSFFDGAPYGVGILAAGFILAIMITPTITAMSREVLRAIPRDWKEAALALGATRWEMMSVALLKNARAGLFAAVTLGLGRALGETMAVTMLIGNQAKIQWSIHAPGQTMASVIANEYAEAFSEMHRAALIEVGLLLFFVTLIINSFARTVVKRLTRIK